MFKFSKGDGKTMLLVMLGVAALGAVLNAARTNNIARYIISGFDA